MKVLVIAQEAQISNALVSQFGVRGRLVQCLNYDRLISSGQPLAIPDDIGVVINTLVLGRESSDQVYLNVLNQLASACDKSNAVFIQLSSSLIFNNDSGNRHRESEQINPASEVSETIFEAERLISSVLEQHIILRIGKVFSHEGANPLTSLVERILESQSLALSHTGNSCPVHASDLARVLSGMIDQVACGGKVWGTYHYHSSDPVTHYKFAEAVHAILTKYDNNLAPGELYPLDEPDEQWAAPLLNCEKILNTFGIKQLPWRSFVIPAIKHLLIPDQKNSGSDQVN